MARTPSNEPEQFQPESDTLLLEDQSLRYGFIQLPKLVLYARNITRDAKFLYAILLGYAWQEGRCFPGYHRLCEDMQASENAVRKYMRELEAVNLLRQKRRGLGKTNIYTMLDLRTAKIEVQEPQLLGRESRTANSEVQEPAKSTALEPMKSEVAEPTKNEVKLETIELETEGIRSSNFRKQSTQERSEKEKVSVPLRPAHYPNDNEDAASMHIDSEVREQLLHFAQDFAREFNDAAPLRSSTSRLANLYHRAGMPMTDFIDHLYAARSITKERTAAIRTLAGDPTAEWQKNKAGYFFAVLESRLGLREQPEYHAPSGSGVASFSEAEGALPSQVEAPYIGRQQG
jgi:hypothetical protein